MGTYGHRSHASTWAVPVIARLRIAPIRPSRWQLDGELGLMPLASHYTQEDIFTSNQTGQTSVVSEDSDSYTDLMLIGGLGGTYRPTQHLLLTADARLTLSYIRTVLTTVFPGNNFSPLQPALSVGVGYQFGGSR